MKDGAAHVMRSSPSPLRVSWIASSHADPARHHTCAPLQSGCLVLGGPDCLYAALASAASNPARASGLGVRKRRSASGTGEPPRRSRRNSEGESGMSLSMSISGAAAGASAGVVTAAATTTVTMTGGGTGGPSAGAGAGTAPATPAQTAVNTPTPSASMACVPCVSEAGAVDAEGGLEDEEEGEAGCCRPEEEGLRRAAGRGQQQHRGHKKAGPQHVQQHHIGLWAAEIGERTSQAQMQVEVEGLSEGGLEEEVEDGRGSNMRASGQHATLQLHLQHHQPQPQQQQQHQLLPHRLSGPGLTSPYSSQPQPAVSPHTHHTCHTHMQQQQQQAGVGPHHQPHVSPSLPPIRDPFRAAFVSMSEGIGTRSSGQHNLAKPMSTSSSPVRGPRGSSDIAVAGPMRMTCEGLGAPEL